jgi:integrase
MHVPKYRKHATKNIGFVEWRRRRYYFSGRYDSAESREAYRQFLFDNVGAPPADPAPPPGEHTVASLMLAYLDYAERFYGPGSRGEYSNCKHALKPLAKKHLITRAEAFGPKMLKAWLEERVAAGHSRPYVNSQLSKIKRAFRWAVAEELVPVAVYQALCTVPGLRAGHTDAAEPARRRPVPWGDVEAALLELSPVVADMVRIQWFTGVRSQSLCMAKAEQFDQTQDPWIWRPRHKTEKRGRILEVPIGPRCKALLEPYLTAAANGGYLFDPRRRRKNRIYGQRYKTTSYYRAIQRAIARVNAARVEKDPQAKLLEPWFPHQLRHSKGQLIREKYGAEGAQSHLGHDSLEATEIYSERRLELAKQIARETG